MSDYNIVSLFTEKDNLLQVIAIATVGPGAAVGLYYVDREGMKSKLERIDDVVHPAAEDDENLNKDAAQAEEQLPLKPLPDDKTSSVDLSSSRIIAPSPRSKNNRLQQARDIMAKMKTRLQYKARK